MCVPSSAPPKANGTSECRASVSVPVLSFTPFHHWNCPNGFIYFHSRGALRVCELPSSKTSTILPSSGVCAQKAEFGATLPTCCTWAVTVPEVWQKRLKRRRMLFAAPD
ncbi:hypothetical protein GN244_ATG16759 [Phytophthora infestans]|uniref:Uncharacterized protein n=1 Tax=Phytophthora infestans TaxID=4787 RepID=A0A833W744_PHYIN|nr:hypothetical protein GN244_ATG16759 [Phytophthora infestans]